MRSEVLRVHRSIGAATLYVTHDQTEAMTMGDRVAVLQAGVLQQYDTPRAQTRRARHLHHRPGAAVLLRPGHGRVDYRLTLLVPAGQVRSLAGSAPGPPGGDTECMIRLGWKWTATQWVKNKNRSLT